MQDKFLIRTVALKLLEELYIKSDYDFTATINAFELFTYNENIDKKLVQKAGKYLKDKKFIQTEQYASDEWEATILCDGIDWLENSYNINIVL